ncbi:hypothetical protein PaG_03818 [Moesziomyces aphidis]|uniref:Monooxygenase n=1 Tax=Moesziomyces aphidis TaxID=84754 RepID=W3VND2_MOEAP|nr:hypothetical protein PaG_03818 [Moesziomyces aphidis]
MMEKDEIQYKPVFEPFASQPWSQYAHGSGNSAPGRPKSVAGMPRIALALLRDNFTITTWLLMGASLQCAVVAIFGASLWVVALPVGVLALRVLRALLQTAGALPNPQMEGVIRGRTMCHFPDDDGVHREGPSNRPLAVLLISAKCNHPLGMLGPGFREAGDFFKQCVDWLEEDSHARGFLGMTQWLNAADRTTNNELLSIGYFRSVEDIHALAHHAVHRAPWKWWNESLKELDHITLTHEIFSVEAGGWENIFLNSKPTQLGTAVVKGNDGQWRSPLVYIPRSLGSSSKRMRRNQTEAEARRQQETDAITGDAY